MTLIIAIFLTVTIQIDIVQKLNICTNIESTNESCLLVNESKNIYDFITTYPEFDSISSFYNEMDDINMEKLSIGNDHIYFIEDCSLHSITLNSPEMKLLADGEIIRVGDNIDGLLNRFTGSKKGMLDHPRYIDNGSGRFHLFLTNGQYLYITFVNRKISKIRMDNEF